MVILYDKTNLFNKKYNLTNMNLRKNPGEHQRSSVPETRTRLRSAEKARVMDDTSRYIDALQDSIEKSNLNEINEFLQKEDTQKVITAVQEGRFDSLKLHEKRDLLTASLMFRQKMILEMKIGDLDEEYEMATFNAKFAEVLAPNCLVTLDNTNVLQNLILPLFGNFKVETQSGRLIKRDFEGHEIGYLESGEQLKLDYTADPSIKMGGPLNLHVYNAVILEDGSKAYVCTEFIGAEQSAEEYEQAFLKDQAQRVEMGYVYNSFKLYQELQTSLPRQIEEIALQIKSIEETFLAPASRGEASKLVARAKADLKSLKAFNIQYLQTPGGLKRLQTLDDDIYGPLARRPEDQELSFYPVLRKLRDINIKAQVRTELLTKFIDGRNPETKLGAQRMAENQEVIKVGSFNDDYLEKQKAFSQRTPLDELEFSTSNGNDVVTMNSDDTETIIAKAITSPENFLKELRVEVLEGILEREDEDYRANLRTFLDKTVIPELVNMRKRVGEFYDNKIAETKSPKVIRILKAKRKQIWDRLTNAGKALGKGRLMLRQSLED